MVQCSWLFLGGPATTISGGNTLAEKTFKWDNNSLIPDTLDVTFPKEITPDETDVKIKLVEFPKPVLVSFVNEAIEVKFINEAGDRLAFSEVEDKQWEMLTKYLAEASRGVKDQDWFKSLKLTSKGIIALVEAIISINHLTEIVSSGGNYFMLPTVIAVLSEANRVESDRQTQMMQA
jgi:hypothetical protein